ncbi:DinB family protein [Marinifilum caeruleilacunae]|nr:DinB family protein [Marinifilum caeruleilacunae]
MHNQIIATTNEIVRQLIDLCEKISPKQYVAPLELLSKNTIGKHLRHIIEFYDILLEACDEDKIVSYDHRIHCTKTETDIEFAKQRLKKASDWLQNVPDQKELKLMVSYDKQGKDSIVIPSSLERELVYNIEHAIHHMAIIRIAVENEFKDVNLDQNFGIAYSTIRFRDDLCAH